MRPQKTLSVLIGILPMTLSSAVQNDTVAVRAPTGTKNAIIQMFEWTWDSIAAECSNFIGPAGYGFVQGRLTLILLVLPLIYNGLYF